MGTRFARCNRASFIVGTLAPGAILAAVEVIFEPQFQSRAAVTGLAPAAGFREAAFFGDRLACVIHFEKPFDG